MLSRESYKILKDLPQELPVKYVQPIHKELLNRGYLTEGWNLSVGSYCRITEIGRAAVEEYERTQREERRGDDAIDIARDSNNIARKANRKSTVAIVVAVIAILAQLVSGFRPGLLALLQRLSRG